VRPVHDQVRAAGHNRHENNPNPIPGTYPSQ
jgi:hypothetical protein